MDPGDEAAAASQHNTEPMTRAPMSADDERVTREVLATEYGTLMAALTAAQSASLTEHFIRRTELSSATGVRLVVTGILTDQNARRG